MRHRAHHLVACLLGLSLVVPVVNAEDMQLRSRAINLLDTARALAGIRGGPWIIHTEATFQATADDGTLKSGTYTRTRLPTGSLRQEIRFADYQATFLLIDQQVSSVGPWNYPPFAVRRLFSLVPFSVGFFEKEDVIRAIRDGSAHGVAATCVDYETVHGENRSSNELCVSKADSSVLSIREERRTYEYTRYATIPGVGALYPQHIEYREGNAFAVSVDLALSKLDTAPVDAFNVPAGAVTGTFCKTSSQPIPLHAPQPPAKGGPDAAVTDVAIQLYVANDGTVSAPQVVRAGRADLDAEALKLVGTWKFDPATCNGKPNTVPATILIHFQGR